MAFREFESKKKLQEVIWTDKYTQDNPDKIGRIWNVEYLKERPSGLIVGTDDWVGFLYKSNPMHKYLLEFVSQWHSSGIKSPRLQVRLEKQKPYMTLGVDEEQRSYWEEEDEKWTQCEGDRSTPDIVVNPLPLPLPANCVLPDDGQEEADNHRKENSKKRPITASLNGTKP